jgi:hypothetical protein
MYTENVRLITHINKQLPVNCREIGDEGVLVWSISSCTPTPCTMQSIVVCLTAGSAETEMAQRVIRRWREPRAIVTTFSVFVAHPMKTGRRRSSVYKPSVVTAQGSRSACVEERVDQKERNTPEAKLVVASGDDFRRGGGLFCRL